MSLLTIPEWGKSVGLARQTSYEAVKRCDIPVKDGKVDDEVATLLYRRSTRARVKTRDVPPASAPEGRAHQELADTPAPPAAALPAIAEPGYASHRARRELADAERAEIETSKLAGRLVDRERGERAVFESFRELRDAIFAATKSQARRVLGLTEIREIELALEDEARDAFAGWEERMKRRLQEAAAS